MSNRYSAEVFYPNGYGVYFERRSSSGEDSGGWDLSLLSKGKIFKEAEEFNAFYFDLSEEEIVNLCDQLYFLPAAWSHLSPDNSRGIFLTKNFDDGD